MDSLAWSKKYEVLSISRLYLESIGIPHEQVASLGDEDMTRIAEIVIAHLFCSEYDEEVKFTTRIYLAERKGNAKGS